MFLGTISGFIGSDAVVRTSGERKFITFSVAVSGFRKKDSNDTVWVHCTYFQTNLEQYLKKGKSVIVVGEISVGMYEGNPEIKCSVNHIELVGRKEGGE